ncbi:MAG: hypothetical protein N2445_00350 [Acidobacteria bacterium]|nr:hypothetical protein [Acidobacteriota bacterium]
MTNAWRISYGEIPNRDIFEIIPPFSFLPTAFVFKIFGPSILGARIISFILAIMLVAILNMVLKKVAVDFLLRFVSISLLVPFGVSYWPVPSHHWWCDLFCLLSAYFLLLISNEGGILSPSQRGAKVGTKYVLSGLFCGLAVWTLQDQGGYLFILLLSFLIYRSIKIKNVAEGKPLKSVLQFLLGFIIATIPFLLWLLPTAGFSKLLQDLVLFPLTGICLIRKLIIIVQFREYPSRMHCQQ